jgi:outer membrane autotransporter protein
MNSTFKYTAMGFWGHDTYEIEGVLPVVFEGEGAESPEMDVLAGAETKGHRAGLYLQGSRCWYVGCFELEPMIAVQYLHLNTKGFRDVYTEKNTQSVMPGFEFGKASTDSFRSFIGARAGFCSGCFVPSAQVQWVHEFLDRESPISPLTDMIESDVLIKVSTAVREHEKDWALLGLGADWRVGENFSLFASYDVQIGSDFLLHHGKVGLELVW